jgi:hypothetical protein
MQLRTWQQLKPGEFDKMWVLPRLAPARKETDGKYYADEATMANCATFMRWLGLTPPEPTGFLRPEKGSNKPSYFDTVDDQLRKGPLDQRSVDDAPAYQERVK